MTLLEILFVLALVGSLIMRGKRANLILGLAAVVFAGIVILGYWRWQQVPLVASGLLLLIASHRGVANPWVRRTLIGFGGLGLLLGGVLLWALPVYAPPTPLGEYAIGVRHFEVADPDRDEPNTEADTDHRRVMVSMWYPARLGDDSEPAAYLPDAAFTSASYARKIGWPAFSTSHLKLFRSHAYQDAAPLDAEGGYPLIIYSHGLSNDRFEAVSRLQHLASSGYVVLSIGHAYGSHATRFPDGSVTGFRNFRTADMDADAVDEIRINRAELWLADARMVINAVRALPDVPPIDFERVGYLGFSAGGTAATLALDRWELIDVAVNLDGTPRGSVVGTALSKPVLFLQSQPPQVSDEQLAAWGVNREDFWDGIFRVGGRMAELVRLSNAPAEHYILRGTKHSNFTDFPSWTPISHLVGIGGEVESFRAMCAIDAKVVAFFARHLKAREESAACEESEELWIVPNRDGLPQ